ncbi:hypothetical protein ACYOEI_42135, partial [Singulisphaera rosea]
EREAAITAAKAALADYQKEAVPKAAEAQRLQATKTAKLEAELKTYEATVPAKLAAWEKSQSTTNRWIPLNPGSLQASNGAMLTKEADLSITVSGKNEKGVLTVVADTDFTGITGVRLEVLTDDRYPQKGPGRASDGNFVLNEVELTATSKADPKSSKPVAFQAPLADFSQAGFEVAKVIDGNPNDPNSGWAVSPTTGVGHWATFETKEPVGFDKGTVLTFKLHHQFDAPYMLGRFRLSVTRVAHPVGLGLSEEL